MLGQSFDHDFVFQVTFGLSCAELGAARLGATKPSKLPRERRPWHRTDARHLRGPAEVY